MKQSRLKVLKTLPIKYRKTINDAIFTSSLFFINISFLIAKAKISRIKIGEYPEQPIEIRNELLNEAMPGIIISSIVIGFLLAIVMFWIGLIIRFRRKYNIYVFHEIKLYLKEKKASKKD